MSDPISFTGTDFNGADVSTMYPDSSSWGTDTTGSYYSAGTGSSGSWYDSLASGLNATNDVLKPLVGIAGSGVSIYKAIAGSGGGGGGGTVVLPGKTNVIKTGGAAGAAQSKNNTILYIIIGAVVLLLVGVLFLGRRGK